MTATLVTMERVIEMSPAYLKAARSYLGLGDDFLLAYLAISNRALLKIRKGDPGPRGEKGIPPAIAERMAILIEFTDDYVDRMIEVAKSTGRLYTPRIGKNVDVIAPGDWREGAPMVFPPAWHDIAVMRAEERLTTAGVDVEIEYMSE